MKLETQMLVAKNIRTLRKVKCISQTDFAEMVHVSRATYASYELGNRVPDAEILFSIARKFGLNMNVFFECDPYKFLEYLEGGEIFEEGLIGLVSNYKKLSAFSKGMLIERSVSLVEWDKMIETNRMALHSRMNQK